MAVLYRILNTGGETEPELRRRDWIDIGQAIAVDGFVLMPVEIERTAAALQLYDAQGTYLHQFPLAPMSFEPAAPYRLIPRAVQITRTGRIARALMETQYTGADKPGWAQREDDHDNEHIQSISYAG